MGKRNKAGVIIAALIILAFSGCENELPGQSAPLEESDMLADAVEGMITRPAADAISENLMGFVCGLVSKNGAVSGNAVSGDNLE